MEAIMNDENIAATRERAPPKGAVQQYVSFMLGSEEYGADIARVQEIKGWDVVTRVPYTADYLLGVVNLRGAIIPVIDLRMRFSLDCVRFEPTTVIVVVRVAAPRGERIVGLVVDSINQVHDVQADAIMSSPPLSGGSVEQEFIKGMAPVDGKLVILLDIEKLVSASIGPG
jgi:purine-binding chemotaxis protein CheW